MTIDVPLTVWDESSLFEEVENDDDFTSYHASLTHEDLEAGGRPTRPLEFPTPVVHDGAIVELTAYDHRTGAEYALKNVLRRRTNADTAYLIKKKLAKSSYGWVKLGVVLKRADAKSQWQSTGDFVAIKCSSWSKIQSMRGRHLVDPIKEISVLQLIGNNSDSKAHHVMGCMEVLQTDEFLYTVMPHCEGGELLDKFDVSGLQTFPDEELARFYFRQLLKSLVFLQRKGICHRNVCLENLHLDGQDNLVLLDSGLALRVPYCDASNIDGVTDVSEGTIRRLMRPQGQCGQLRHLAPEILEQHTFDGHATDLWAASIALFIMLVGVAPFGMAQCSDKRFETIAQKGRLKEFLSSLDVSLSAEAVDLLQNLLWLDPRDRFTLADAMAHPWVLGECFPVVQDAPLARVESNHRLLEKEHISTQVPDSPTSTTGIVQVEEQAPQKQHRRKRSSGAKDSFKGVLKFVRKYGTSGSSKASQQSKTKPLEDDLTVSESSMFIDT